MVNKYNYNIKALNIRPGSNKSQTINNKSFEKQENNNAGVKVTFQDGIGTDGEVEYGAGFPPRPYNLYGVPADGQGKFPSPPAKTVNGYWGNKDQEKINFNKNNRTDAYSLGRNYIKDGQNLTPIYNLKRNTIQNFTLPNGQNLLYFLKENNVQTGENVQIKITKDGVKLIKKK